MSRLNREDIHIISRHSNWSSGGVAKVLQEEVYHDRAAWQKFLRLFFISLGVGFTASGIIFFFAYNWADLHKFAKLGIAEALVVATVAVVLFSGISLNLKNIILTGASVLVGVLFAVFGQIYQTGANAYDFFLGWTVFISLWALVSNFPPLWLIYLTLINTTFILYAQQVAQEWTMVFVFTMLLIFNTAILVLFIWLSKGKQMVEVPAWFSNIIALAAVSFSTTGIIIGVFDSYQPFLMPLILATVLVYAGGIVYGFQAKSGFYLSVIPFSIIIIITAILIRISNDAAMFFVISFFVIGSVTMVIKKLISLQKKWING